MADSTITNLPNEVITPASGDYMVIDDISASSETKKITFANLSAAISQSAAGSDTELQINSSGSLGADSQLVWNSTTKTLKVNAGGNGAKIRAEAEIADSYPVLYLNQKDSAEPGILISQDSSDADIILARVDVTGSPELSWDESEDSFSFSSVVHVKNATAGAVTLPTSAIHIVENSSDAYISILTPAANAGGILFGDPGDNDIGRMIYDHSDNSLKITTNGTEQVAIDSSGNVGLGTSTMDSTLHIFDGSAGTVTAVTNTALTVENSGAVYISLLASSGNTSGIYFGAGTTNNSALVQWEESTGHLEVTANTSTGEVHILTEDGDLAVDKDGNILVNHNEVGGGVKVIAIQNAVTVPASNPTGGGILYVEAGALKYRGSSGTTTTIATA